MRYLEKQQAKEAMRVVGRVMNICFTDCANDFTSSMLSSAEEQCIGTCTQKFMKYSLRMNAKFQQENAKITG